MHVRLHADLTPFHNTVSRQPFIGYNCRFRIACVAGLSFILLYLCSSREFPNLNTIEVISLKVPEGKPNP